MPKYKYEKIKSHPVLAVIFLKNRENEVNKLNLVAKMRPDFKENNIFGRKNGIDFKLLQIGIFCFICFFYLLSLTPLIHLAPELFFGSFVLNLGGF
ncbi:MAG: hypothetical protein ACOCUV_00015 [bacterium]